MCYLVQLRTSIWVTSWDWLFVCLRRHSKQLQFVHFVGMLKQEMVISDFEGFCCKKSVYIIKELSLCSSKHSDTILFLPPVSYNSPSASDRRSHNWVSKFLHGLSWNSGTYPYWFLSQIFVAIKFRFQLGKFYAKGKEKRESLQLSCRKS